MYKHPSRIVYGFHGCDRKTKEEILHGNSFFSESTNAYDWLGSGIYFWENDEQRALEFAQDAVKNTRQTRGIIKEPAVIGAVIDLGNCCDLMNRKNVELLRVANEFYLKLVGGEENAAKNKGKLPDMKGRYRDCVVINMLHSFVESQKTIEPFDTVRSVFFEGEFLYPTSAFCEFTHIQICVRNPNCIKAVFDPRKPDANHRIP